jgi:peptidoglycan/xylan/chitin deacetylase (PgdA/CDA1 family)
MSSSNALRNSLFTLYKCSGASWLEETVRGWLGHRAAAILLFHRVTDDLPEDPLTVSAARFREYCRLFRRKFNVISLDEIHRTILAGRKLPPRALAITFDDSYRFNLTAARILREHDLPAAFFLSTDHVETDHIFPWDRHLPRVDNLSWEEARELADMGFEIGSHTCSHANMGAVDPGQARRELFESKEVLEERLGVAVRWLAYPFGGRDNWDAEWMPLLEEAGYAGCLSGYGGFVGPGVDCRLLPREPVNSRFTALHLELYLQGSLHWYHGIKSRLGWRGEIIPEVPPALEISQTIHTP